MWREEDRDVNFSMDIKDRECVCHKHTRFVCSTLARRGKSLTPESRIDILEERSAFVARKDETQDSNGLVIFIQTSSVQLSERCSILFT